MKPPLYVRELTQEEQAALKAGVQSSDGFAVRRSQIILASANKQRASQIAEQLHCGRQTVREVIHAFAAAGLGCLQRGSHAPLSVKAVLTAEKREQIQAMLQQSPRTFGKASSRWTL